MRLLVLGMHRSGTSLMVRMLEAQGFWAGADTDFHPPTAHDPEGHREHRDVHALDSAALAWIDRDWDQPAGIDWEQLPPARLADVLGAIQAVVARLDGRPDWVAKDPRLCLTLPLWRQIVEPACLLVHRNPLEVARSLEARDGLPTRFGIALWEAYARAAVQNSTGLPRLAVDHAQLTTDPAAALGRLQQWWATMRPGPTSLPDAQWTVRPGLLRHHASAEETAAWLNDAQQRLWAAITVAVAAPPGSDDDELSAAASEPLSAPAAALLSAVRHDR